MEAEWIDLPAASVDGVLCRWGYMLVADPEAALRETRRVLRPGGRVALAVWASPGAQPVARVVGREAVRAGLRPAPTPPSRRNRGPSRSPTASASRSCSRTAGFDDVVLDTVDVTFEADSLDAWWDQIVRTSGRMLAALETLSPAEHYAPARRGRRRLRAVGGDDGRLRVPGRTLVASATA